jgi:hypothetical protein
MLTSTSIVLPYDVGDALKLNVNLDAGLRARSVTEYFRRQTRLEHWPLLAHDWQNVHRISIPDLSVKERLRIHEDLRVNHGDLDVVGGSLPFRVGDDEEDTTLEAVQMYSKYYRYYPNFLPVII